MSDIINISILFLAALLHATLQFSLGCLTLLYHESSGRFITKKTKRLVGSFISGIGIMTLLLFGVSCFVVDRLLGLPLSDGTLYIIIGTLIALALIMWFFYYRRGASTELWLPKPIARFTDSRAKATSSNTEAFSLGLFCALAELPLAAVPLIVATSALLVTSPHYHLLLIAYYALIVITPLLIFRFAIHTGRTAVDVQKWRLKNKTFLRLVSGLAFLALAAFIIVFEVIP